MKRKTDNFSKFFNRKSNSAIKESIKQEKKTAKRERKAAIEEHFEKKRQAKALRAGAGNANIPFEPGSIKKEIREGRGHTPSGQTGKPASEKPAFEKKPFGKPTPGKPASGKPISGKPASGKLIAGNSAGSNPATGRQVAGKYDKRPIPAAAAANPASAPKDGDQLPLNKYIAHGGLCSRRDAAELIRLGKVQVNGQSVTEPGTKVSPSDEVKVNGKKVTISRNFVYILLNKPKDYITTTDDPQGRKTVLDLIRQATTERVYPVGRLDRNTSGVLLLTNDGELAQKLAHPKHEIKKIYHVTLDKVLTKGDFDKIINGEVILEDGPAVVDVIAYADSRDKTQIGLEIHSGRNRIVRRIFEQLGYDVRGLDRVMYAGLTKKNVQRAKWRLLSEKEIRILKYLNASFKGSLSPRGASVRKEEGGNGHSSKHPIRKATGKPTDDDLSEKYLGWDEDEDAPKERATRKDPSPFKGSRSSKGASNKKFTPDHSEDKKSRPDRKDRPEKGRPARAAGPKKFGPPSHGTGPKRAPKGHSGRTGRSSK